MNEACDISQIERMCAQMKGETLLRKMRDALKIAGNEFAKVVEARVAASPIGGGRAVRVKVDQPAQLSVDLFNRSNPLARIYEGGTYKAEAKGGRKVKTYRGVQLTQPANRGNIRPYYFLTDAYEQGGEAKLIDDYTDAITQLIQNQ